jgi:hypothetical protein
MRSMSYQGKYAINYSQNFIYDDEKLNTFPLITTLSLRRHSLLIGQNVSLDTEGG